MGDLEFRRTDAGIANYPVFLGVDAIFYCEGEYGKADLTREGVLNPSYEDIDCSFWKPIVTHLLPGKRVAVKSFGNKVDVLNRVAAAARYEVDHGVRASFGCLDRDFLSEDEVLSECVEVRVNPQLRAEMRHRLLLTEGYSVESDLLVLHSSCELIELFIPRLPAARRREVEASLEMLRRYLRRIVIIDRAVHYEGYCFINTEGLPSFIEKLKFPHDILSKAFSTLFLEFRRNVLRKAGLGNFTQLRTSGINRKIPTLDRKVDGFADFRGKALVKIVANLLNKIGKTLPKWAPLGDERIIDVLIGEHRRLMRGDVSRLESQRSLGWVQAVCGKRQISLHV